MGDELETIRIDKVELHSLALFNISDHVTRGSESKFGILLGLQIESHIVVYTSFETLVESSNIDGLYLQKRLDQFRTVHPTFKILGIYHISNSTNPDSLTISIAEQVQQSIKSSSPLVYIVLDEKELAVEESSSAFRSYIHGKNVEIKTEVRTNESEYIATSTVVNHNEYFSTEKPKERFADDTSTFQHKENMLSSLTHLGDKVSKVLHYLEDTTHQESVSEEDLAIKLEIQNLVTHLSNKLKTLTSSKDNGAENVQLELQTSQLSLLTEQLTIIDNLKAQVSRNVIWHGLTK